MVSVESPAETAPTKRLRRRGGRGGGKKKEAAAAEEETNSEPAGQLSRPVRLMSEQHCELPVSEQNVPRLALDVCVQCTGVAELCEGYCAQCWMEWGGYNDLAIEQQQPDLIRSHNFVMRTDDPFEWPHNCRNGRHCRDAATACQWRHPAGAAPQWWHLTGVQPRQLVKSRCKRDELCSVDRCLRWHTDGLLRYEARCDLEHMLCSQITSALHAIECLSHQGDTNWEARQFAPWINVLHEKYVPTAHVPQFVVLVAKRLCKLYAKLIRLNKDFEDSRQIRIDRDSRENPESDFVSNQKENMRNAKFMCLDCDMLFAEMTVCKYHLQAGHPCNDTHIGKCRLTNGKHLTRLGKQLNAWMQDPTWVPRWETD